MQKTEKWRCQFCIAHGTVPAWDDQTTKTNFNLVKAEHAKQSPNCPVTLEEDCYQKNPHYGIMVTTSEEERTYFTTGNFSGQKPEAETPLSRKGDHWWMMNSEKREALILDALKDGPQQLGKILAKVSPIPGGGWDSEWYRLEERGKVTVTMHPRYKYTSEKAMIALKP